MNTRSGPIYNHELTNTDHSLLLDLLKQHKGPVILSGYRNILYESKLEDWHTHEASAITEAGKTKVEVIWCNYKANMQMSLDECE
jgi:DNA adenine methylase